jgi:glycosyltransferase involved in cell wall biosynthesis
VPPTVSILVPCYNSRPWVEATLESALAQTWQDIEIIAVDDGSTDGTSAHLEPFVTRGVKVVRQPNRGASAARNRALQEAGGDFIQFLDADDLLSPGKIAVQVEALKARGRTWVASSSWGRFETEAADAVLVPEAVWRDQPAIDFLVTSALVNLMFPVCAWLLPRQLCEAAGPWDETLSMNDDGEYMARVLAASDGIVFCEQARAYYRSTPTSYSSRRTDVAAVSDLRAWDAIVAAMMRLEASDRVARAAATGYQRIQVRYSSQCPGVVAEAERKERSFGGGSYRFAGGPVFRATSRLLGWKNAMRLRRVKARLTGRLDGS